MSNAIIWLNISTSLSRKVLTRALFARKWFFNRNVREIGDYNNYALIGIREGFITIFLK